MYVLFGILTKFYYEPFSLSMIQVKLFGFLLYLIKVQFIVLEMRFRWLFSNIAIIRYVLRCIKISCHSQEKLPSHTVSD